MNLSVKNWNMILAAALIPAAAVGAYIWLNKRRNADLPVAPHVELDRYLGEWYEIARMPVRYEKGCYGTRAIYAKRDDGDIDVLNICHKGSPTGELEIAKGKACVVDTETNARLKVSFFWPFSGDYWILEVGPQYEYALVGTPDRSGMWILSRTPEMDKALSSKLIRRAEELGFNTFKLIFTRHQRTRSRTTVGESATV